MIKIELDVAERVREKEVKIGTCNKIGTFIGTFSPKRRYRKILLMKIEIL